MSVEKSSRKGLLISIVYLLLSVLPCAVAYRWSVWLVLAVWVVGAGVRLGCRDRKVVTDCVLFGGVNMVVLRRELVQAIWKRWDGFCVGWVQGLRLSILLGAVVPLAVLGLFVQRRYGSNASIASTSGKLPEETWRRTLDYPKSLVFPCRTTHARIFPKGHAFGYSYLLCGFPIVPAGTIDDGTDVGNGKDRALGSWWLRVRAEDYLARGYGSVGFYGKLKAFLREQGVEGAQWSYAYLVTAPRFFGYAFNPVSFWYIYNRDHELKKMVLEVNNTFGERHIYLLDGPSPSRARSTGLDTSALHASKSKFMDIWMKDFHVSPFSSRKGSYALKALNPFPLPNYSDPRIDNTITLKSSKDYAKVVARVYTTGRALNPAQFGFFQTLRFIVSWWWVGFMTFPRIIREAFKLYFWNKLHVWFRPEVMASSIGRSPTSTEAALQKIFKEYLDHLVNTSPESFHITYETAIPEIPKQIITTSPLRPHNQNFKTLDLRTTTPAFYSRFVHYAHTSEALDRECLFTDAKNRTLCLSQPELLPLLLPTSQTPNTANNDGMEVVKRSHLDELRWTLLRKLRCPPAEPAYAVTPKGATTFVINDIRRLPFSELDCFVRRSGARAYAGAYRRMVTKIFLAQRFALGFLEIIDVLDLLLRLGLCWVGGKKISLWAGGIEHARSSEESVERLVSAALEWRWVLGMVVYVSGCHAYGFLKGYK